MKVSQARLAEAIELRDAALGIVAAFGTDRIITATAGGYRHSVQTIEFGELTIMYGSPSPGGEQRLDIWEGRKVFSIAWNRTGLADVIAFRPEHGGTSCELTQERIESEVWSRHFPSALESVTKHCDSFQDQLLPRIVDITHKGPTCECQLQAP